MLLSSRGRFCGINIQRQLLPFAENLIDDVKGSHGFVADQTFCPLDRCKAGGDNGGEGRHFPSGVMFMGDNGFSVCF